MSKQDARELEFKYAGHDRGDINAVISTGQLRERLKPFVFLDHFDVKTDDRWGFAFHPHSGVAALEHGARRIRELRDELVKSGRLRG